MTYAVVWSMAAIGQLNRILQAAADPALVHAATNRIDYALRRTPRDMGESRDRGYRLWYEDVLGVWYSIDEGQLLVRIDLVCLSRRR
jgi:hypothetical protein